jgi:hypothetical protein
MIRMAKKQSKLNLGRNRLLHVALPPQVQEWYLGEESKLTNLRPCGSHVSTIVWSKPEKIEDFVP